MEVNRAGPKGVEEIDLRLKPEVKHAVRFVENDKSCPSYVSDSPRIDCQHVNHPTRSAHNNVTAPPQFRDLYRDVDTTVHARNHKPKRLSKLFRFVVPGRTRIQPGVHVRELGRCQAHAGDDKWNMCYLQKMT
jgi:hypothetical protein